MVVFLVIWTIAAIALELILLVLICLVHHAEILALKGASYRLKDCDLARTPPLEN